MSCKKCQSNDCVKAGFIRGLQRYKCKECSSYFTLTPPRHKDLSQKLLGLHLYLSGMSLRAIGKVMRVSQVAVMTWVKTLVPQICPKVEPQGRVMVMELDEMWHYLKKSPTSSGSGRLIAAIPVDSLIGNVGVVIEKPVNDFLTD